MKVSLENITIKYGDAIAVENLSLEISDNESLVLLGKSGCGKTTTMRSIAGLETPTKGRITIGDTVVFDSERGINVPSNQRNVGMVFQSYAVWPHRTIFENVAFPLKMQKVTKAEIEARVNEVLDLVGLLHLRDRGASLLSGGQMQRVALARSLVMHPSVLLLDEPLSNLDARLRERLRVELRDIQQRLGLTCVYVTHDQSEAMALADRIALMQGGKIVQCDGPASVYENPASATIADFLGVSNVLQLTTAGDAYTFHGTKLPVNATGSCLTDESGSDQFACIRPEDLTLTFEPSNSHNTWPATVNVVSYQGAFTLYQVTLEGGPVIEVMATRRHAIAVSNGDSVWVNVDAAAIQVLPEDVSTTPVRTKVLQ